MVTFEDKAGGKVALKGHHGKYLCAEPSGVVCWNRGQARAWETFELGDVGGGRFTLRSHHGKFVCAEKRGERGGGLVANRDKAQAWETFARGHGAPRGSSKGGAHHAPQYPVAVAASKGEGHRHHLPQYPVAAASSAHGPAATPGSVFALAEQVKAALGLSGCSSMPEICASALGPLGLPVKLGELPVPDQVRQCHAAIFANPESSGGGATIPARGVLGSRPGGHHAPQYPVTVGACQSNGPAGPACST